MQDFPQLEAAVVLIERAGKILAEYNPKWQCFSLPVSRLRRRLGAGEPTRETPLDAAVRTAAQALGRPLSADCFPEPVSLDGAETAYLRSNRDQQTKRYTYHLYALHSPDGPLRHALARHTIWMRPEDFLTHHPVSPTAVHIIRHLPAELFVN
jgi:hypothetical protein